MKIIRKEMLADTPEGRIVRMNVRSPEVARKARPGQFVVLMVAEEGERIPLTVVDTNGDEVVLIFQEVGLSTRLLNKLKEGDDLYALLGPLGHATDIRNTGRVILVAGGVGIAEIYPVARAFKEAGNHVTVIAGARTAPLIFLEDELQRASDDFHVTTDDGSRGRRGFTTDVLKELLAASPVDLVYAVGPLPMMRKAAEVTRPFGVRTVVSLNTLMMDGTGMCGGCRVTVGGKVAFACVGGPEFDGHQVDWDEMAQRNRMYAEQEKHICELYKIKE